MAGSRGVRLARIIALILFYTALPLALIATDVRIAFSDEHVYQYSIDHYDVPAVTGISRADLLAATEDIRAYFGNDEDYLRTVVHDQNGAVEPLFNAKEVLHMHDVKSLVRFVYALGTLSLCYLLAYVVCVYLWAREDSLAGLARLVLRACAFTVGLLALFGVAAATGGFDALFIDFHELVFNNDYWQLDPARDHLVQMFPEGFWSDATLLIAVLIIAEIVLLAGASWWYLRRVALSPSSPRRGESDQPSPGTSVHGSTAAQER